MAKANTAFSNIIESANYGILIHRKSKPIYLNPACARIFGFDSSATFLEMESILDLFASDDQSLLNGPSLGLPPGTSPPLIDINVIKKDGSPIKIRCDINRVKWEGKPASCLTLHQTLPSAPENMPPSEQEAARLKESQSQLLDALNRISSGIALFDNNDRLIFSNDAYGRLLEDRTQLTPGITFEEILRAYIKNGHIPEAQEDPESWLANRLKTHRNPDGLIEVTHGDGTCKMILEQKTRDGGILMTITDVTEQKEAEKARNESDAYLKAFVEHFPAAVFIKDRDAKYIYVNQTFREWVNVSNEQILGSTISSFVDSNRANQLAELDRQALEHRKTSTVENLSVFPDGIERTVLATRFPVIDPDGNVVGVCGFLTDMTSYHQARQELELQTGLYTALLDHLPNAVSAKDTNGCYIIANRQLQIWRNIPTNEFIGRTNQELFNNTTPLSDARNAQEEAVRKHQTVITREEWREGPDGVNRFYEWVKFPVFDKNKKLIAIGTIGTDMTERKAVEQHLRAAKETAEFANRAKSDFLAHMSHELRTPLNAVIGFSQLMMTETFGKLGHQNYHDYAKDIFGAGNHLLNVISDILDISKVEAGELDLDIDDVDIGLLMASSFKMMRSRADNAELTLALKLPRNLPVFRGDELRLRQILLNLLSNAIKFTRAGGSITVSVRQEADGAIIWEVADTGIGIPEEDITRVLKPFEQARQGFTLSHEGTGLGLYLTQTLVELHRGHLKITSQLDKGTTVHVHFPPERAQPKN